MGLWLLALAGAGAEEKFDFKTHGFFKHLLGEWTTEGEMKGTEGNVVRLKEEWNAEVVGENTLTITGKRELNDDKQSYKWTITRDPATGLLEASHRGSEDNPDTQRFEISVSEAEMKMEMSGFLGSGEAPAHIGTKARNRAARIPNARHAPKRAPFDPSRCRVDTRQLCP